MSAGPDLDSPVLNRWKNGIKDRLKFELVGQCGRYPHVTYYSQSLALSVSQSANIMCWHTNGKITSATPILSTNLSRISFVLIGYMQMKYPNLMRPDDCENYPATEIITYSVQPVNVWGSSCSMLIVCRLSMFPGCQQVSQQPQVYQTIWQQLHWCHWLKKTVNNVIIDITFTSLTANGSLSIVQMSISMLDSHYNGVGLRTGKVTTA